MRTPRPRRPGRRLQSKAQNAADVLEVLASTHPEVKQRIDDYLSVIIPGAEGADQIQLDKYGAVQVRMRDTETGQTIPFGPESVSAGTLRVIGLLAGLFQPDALTQKIPLVCVDEPELGLHPSAAGAVFDAVTEAAGHVQIILATQSGDLLDRDEFDPDWIRVVAWRDGRTVIAPIDETSRRILAEKLSTVGELMRDDQLLPAESEEQE